MSRRAAPQQGIMGSLPLTVPDEHAGNTAVREVPINCHVSSHSRLTWDLQGAPGGETELGPSALPSQPGPMTGGRQGS